MTDTKRPKQATPAELKRAVDAFNKKFPVGTEVLYRSSPGGPVLRTKTRSEAEVLSGHTAVVWVDYVSGCVALDAVAAIDEPAAETKP